RSLEARPPLTALDLSARVPPATSAHQVTWAIRKAARRRNEVLTAASRERWAAELVVLGVPPEAVSVIVETSEVLYWPFYLGLLTKGTGARMVAVDGVSGRVCPETSVTLTGAITHVLRSLG